MGIKNCPRCGGPMRSLTSGDVCDSCGNEIYTTNFTSIDKTILEPNKADSASGLYGWICPKCGAVMSPFERSCINCTQHNCDFIYNTVKVPKHSFSNGSTIYDFLGKRKDKVGYE